MPKRAATISILQPPGRVEYPLRDSDLLSVDLTGRTDVTISIQSLQVTSLSSLPPATSTGTKTATAGKVEEEEEEEKGNEEGREKPSVKSSAASDADGSHRRNVSSMKKASTLNLIPCWLIVPARNYIFLKPVVALEPFCRVTYRFRIPVQPTVKEAKFPPARQWITFHKPTPYHPTVLIRAMTYNILAKKLATTKQYPYCNSYVLDWSYRKTLIMKEIKFRDADILALQEVEQKEYLEFFQPELGKVGYMSVFAPKSRARTMTVDQQMDVNGCAIFYKSNKFVLVSSHFIEFSSLAVQSTQDDVQPCHEVLNRVMTKDDVGLAVLLQTKTDAWVNGVPMVASQALIVSTVQLYWDPKFSDVKLIQMMLLLHELRNIIASAPAHVTQLDRDPAILLCGDFNSLPTSGVMSFLQQGLIDKTHADFQMRDYNRCLDKLSSSHGHSDVNANYRHTFKMKMANGRLPFTNYTNIFRGVIDYILYSSESTLRPLRSLQGLSEQWLRSEKVAGLPHVCVPSDHIPLVVDFEMSAALQTARQLCFDSTQRQNSVTSRPLSCLG